MPFGDPVVATVDADAGRVDVDRLDTSLTKGRNNLPGGRTHLPALGSPPPPTVRKPQQTAPALRAPTPTASPQDDPLAP
jgi:hypothetical protein